MIINVGGISQGTTRLTDTIRPADVHLDRHGAKLATPISIAANVTRMGEDIYVDARVAGELELECSRCLEAYRWGLAARLQVFYVPAGSGARAKHARGSPDGTVKFYREATIDLADDVVELIVSELPRKPLCRPDCRGLCPRCGKPLSDGPCTCPRTDTGYHPFKDLKL